MTQFEMDIVKRGLSILEKEIEEGKYKSGFNQSEEDEKKTMAKMLYNIREVKCLMNFIEEV